MNFIELADAITVTKKLPEETDHIMIPMKHFLSTDARLTRTIAQLDKYYWILGPTRFMRLLAHVIPQGRYTCKMVKKPKKETDKWLEERLARFLVCSRRDISPILELLKKQGWTVAKMKKFFGYNKKG